MSKDFSWAETALSEHQLLTLRAALLKRMKRDIAQRLEGSLHNLVRVDLAGEEQRQQVGQRTDELVGIEPEPVRPLDSLIERDVAFFDSNQEIAPVPAGEQTYRIFHRDDIGKRLLILGEPGAGKTTELLMVAQRLVEEAIEDDSQPIPILFELSGWTLGTPILEWLEEQLHHAYGVSNQHAKKLAHQWVQQNQWAQPNQILLLLDGLDELGGPDQDACIAALEDFLASYGALSALVSCRREDYEQGGQKFRQLRGVISIQPLELAQIRQYLGDLNQTPLLEAIERQPELLELAQLPLSLVMLVVAYDGQAIRDQAALFDAYIQKRLHDPDSQGAYRPGREKTPEQTQRYLCWLAKQLEQRHETEFLIENLQPSWLDSDWQRRLYRLTAGAILGLIGGVSSWLIFVLIFRLSGGLSSGLSDGLSFGLICGLICGLIGGLSEIQPVGNLKWRPFRELILGPLLGLILGLISGLIIQWFIIAFTVGLSFAMSFVLIGGLSDEPIQAKTSPNQGIRRSLQNVLTFGVTSGLISGLVSGLIGGLMGLVFGLNGWSISELIFALKGGLIFGLLGGLFGGMFGGLFGTLSFGLVFGGLQPAIQHFVLRILLTTEDNTPWNYERFLEHAVKHRFIQRNGGRYRFIHSLLRKHFAQMTPQQQSALAQPWESNQ